MPALSDLGEACADARAWPLPGHGDTLRRWQELAAVAERDVVLARLVEAHADALAILSELEGELPAPGRTYGVWAARGPELVLTGGRLHGTKEWCSGATLLSHALVTTSDDVLVEVDLQDAAVITLPAAWASAGMREADTRSVRFEGAPARVVDGDYLDRRGFWAGGVGVAACWFGGTVPLVDPLRCHIAKHPDQQLAAAHLGACITDLNAARATLREASLLVDGGGISMPQALRVRSFVADTAARVLTRVGRALGPAPLAQNPAHARRAADLTVYIRQDHAERDLAAMAAESLEESWSL